MTHTEAVRVDIMCNGSGSVQQYNAMTNGTHTQTRRNAVRSERVKWHKPNDYTQTHGTAHRRQTNGVTRHMLSACRPE